MYGVEESFGEVKVVEVVTVSLNFGFEVLGLWVKEVADVSLG